MTKLPFDIDSMLARIREAIKGKADAALFELYEEGYGTPFQQLVACIISIRTRDEVTLPTARALLQLAPTPAAMAALPVAAIDEAIRASTFHEAKAPQLKAMAAQILADHGGELPCDGAVMQGFRGVGPKCANLVLGIACGQARIAVDVHVWRVTNRWGYIAAATPEQALAALKATLPQAHWVELNRLLVPFGKHICTGKLPKCSTCPVLAYCRQVGVTGHR